MLKIKETNHRTHSGHFFDYLLEDGTMLHSSEWNGEVYTVKTEDGYEKTFRPVYEEIAEDEFVIVGFED